MKLTSLALCAAALVGMMGCGTMGASSPVTAIATQTALSALKARPELSSLVGALEAAQLASTLTGTNPFTIIAPSNDAFSAAGSVADGALANILKSHVIPGKIGAADIIAQMGDGNVATLTSLAGTPITARRVGSDIFFGGADGGAIGKATTADVPAGNSAVHIIDRVVGVGDVDPAREAYFAPAAPDYGDAAKACEADGHTVIDASGTGFCQIAPDGTGWTLETYLQYRS